MAELTLQFRARAAGRHRPNLTALALSPPPWVYLSALPLRDDNVTLDEASDNLLVSVHTYLNSFTTGVMHVGDPTAPEVTLRLNLTVKASSCVEPGSGLSDPQCSGKGRCVTQPSEVRFQPYLTIKTLETTRVKLQGAAGGVSVPLNTETCSSH